MELETSLQLCVVLECLNFSGRRGLNRRSFVGGAFGFGFAWCTIELSRARSNCQHQHTKRAVSNGRSEGKLSKLQANQTEVARHYLKLM